MTHAACGILQLAWQTLAIKNKIAGLTARQSERAERAQLKTHPLPGTQRVRHSRNQVVNPSEVRRPPSRRPTPSRPRVSFQDDATQKPREAPRDERKREPPGPKGQKGVDERRHQPVAGEEVS